MKKEKLSLKGIKNVLSRDEMKKIMAGSAGSVLCTYQGRICGYCGCDTNEACVECCEVICGV